MGCDQCAHAFAIPDDFRARVAFFDELGESVQVVIPLIRIPDIAAAFVDGIAALSADFVGVNGSVTLAFD